jgi:predicted acylesterase/phospholipase RssA
VCATPALDVVAGTPSLFRTYRAPKNQTFDCTIWEAARATTATPTFFEQIVIGTLGSSQPYVDGGLGCNNPVAQVLEEAMLMFPSRYLSCIISIGTGQAQTIKIPPPTWLQQWLPLNIVRSMQGIATDCEQNAQNMMRRFQSTPNVYFRFNVEQGLQEVRLDQWEKLDEVTAHTGQYIAKVEVDRKLGAAVIAVQEKLNRVSPGQISMTLALMSMLVMI